MLQSSILSPMGVDGEFGGLFCGVSPVSGGTGLVPPLSGGFTVEPASYFVVKVYHWRVQVDPSVAFTHHR